MGYETTDTFLINEICKEWTFGVDQKGSTHTTSHHVFQRRKLFNHQSHLKPALVFNRDRGNNAIRSQETISKKAERKVEQQGDAKTGHEHACQQGAAYPSHKNRKHDRRKEEFQRAP